MQFTEASLAQHSLSLGFTPRILHGSDVLHVICNTQRSRVDVLQGKTGAAQPPAAPHDVAPPKLDNQQHSSSAKLVSLQSASSVQAQLDQQKAAPGGVMQQGNAAAAAAPSATAAAAADTSRATSAATPPQSPGASGSADNSRRSFEQSHKVGGQAGLCSYSHLQPDTLPSCTARASVCRAF